LADKDDDENLMRYRFYVETFRISPQTTIQNLKSVACDYWGLVDTEYQIYKIVSKGSPEALDDDTKMKVYKILETFS